jgi:D-arabinose 1-dehydrogenase-like Zn-dependent alcohol dehydrogenase
MGQWLQATNVDGTFAEYVLNRNEHSVRKLEPFVSFVDGAIMGCAGGTAFESLRKTKVNARTKMVVYGLGPVGLCDVVIAKAIGAYVIGVDVREDRLKLGEKHGCDLVINSKEEDPVKKIMELTNDRGLDVAIEASGFAANESIRSVTKDRGIVCVTGLGDDSYKGVRDFNTLMLWERGVWGSSLFPVQSVHELMDILVQQKAHLDSIVDTTYKLSQAQEAHEQFETYRSGKIGFLL